MALSVPLAGPILARVRPCAACTRGSLLSDAWGVVACDAPLDSTVVGRRRRCYRRARPHPGSSILADAFGDLDGAFDTAMATLLRRPAHSLFVLVVVRGRELGGATARGSNKWSNTSSKVDHPPSIQPAASRQPGRQTSRGRLSTGVQRSGPRHVRTAQYVPRGRTALGYGAKPDIPDAR